MSKLRFAMSVLANALGGALALAVLFVALYVLATLINIAYGTL